jgi:hypothetical protein
MQYRETINRKLEAIEGNQRKMEFILKRGGNAIEFSQLIESTKELISEVKSYIERENLSGHELNNR